jgi:large subunit ribosomal protein L33
MAKKSKGNRIQIILECTEHKKSGMPGTSRYVTLKRIEKTLQDRMELKKYNPILNKVTRYTERLSN